MLDHTLSFRQKNRNRGIHRRRRWRQVLVSAQIANHVHHTNFPHAATLSAVVYPRQRRVVAAPKADVALARWFQLQHGVAHGGRCGREGPQRRFAETEVSYLVREQANCHTKCEFSVWGARKSERKSGEREQKMWIRKWTKRKLGWGAYIYRRSLRHIWWCEDPPCTSEDPNSCEVGHKSTKGVGPTTIGSYRQSMNVTCGSHYEKLWREWVLETKESWFILPHSKFAL